VQDGDGVGGGEHREVDLTVAVEIARAQEARRFARREKGGRREPADAVVEEDGHVARAGVAHGDVGVAVVIEVLDDDGLRRFAAGAELDGGQERGPLLARIEMLLVVD
jgi:hypothetical protein